MKDENKFTLWSAAIRQRACSAIMLAEGDSRVTIAPPRRTLDQNAKLHAMIRDMMEQHPASEEGDARRELDEEGWKQAMLMAMGHQVEFWPNPFDGNICAVTPRTSKLSVEQCGEAIEFLYAAGAEWGIRWSEPDLWGHKPQNGEK